MGIPPSCLSARSLLVHQDPEGGSQAAAQARAQEGACGASRPRAAAGRGRGSTRSSRADQGPLTRVVPWCSRSSACPRPCILAAVAQSSRHRLAPDLERVHFCQDDCTRPAPVVCPSLFSRLVLRNQISQQMLAIASKCASAGHQRGQPAAASRQLGGGT